ncbi:restriction endonuclease subunit S [Cyanobium sp. N.Huapi 1H5]|uniref:restriction endonuclease subunit S n=1 Tax=Cyanobium sp. N.Huapi 1H5 TaxID=2823719 RepID=UPI0020CD4D2C|nr:restriction endonuclease subunit S [Cyanobium sp. N.Huapi 1H5]MCP9836226.1 restriction endonuclease subunit S [Cyanobium sp. N.Huapi 1H5]
MSQGWVKKRLSEVTTKIGSGATPRGGDESYKAEGISLIRSLNIYDDGFREAKLARIDEDQANALSNVAVEPQDVLLNITGASVARCCRAPAQLLPARVNQHVSIIRPVQESLDSDFLHYLLISKDYKNRLLSTGEEGGSTRQAITKAQLQDFVVEFPDSLPEQRQIVALLDEAFAGLATAKANAERNLQNARAIFESQLHSVFGQRGEGWVEQALSEICDIKHGYAFEGKFFSAEGDYVLLTPGNFYEAGGYRDRGEKQKYFTGEIPRDYVLREGDLLVAMTEQAAGLLGSSLLVPESDKFLHNQRLGLVTAKPGVAWSNEFFFHVFNTKHVRREIHASASGVKVRHTSPSKIGDVIVSFPVSLQEQSRLVADFVAVSAETQRLTCLYERKLAALEELKKSLLHQAFNGEL